MTPNTTQIVLAFVFLGAVSLLFATAIDESLFLPYHKATSVVDFLVAAAVLAGGSLAVTTTTSRSSLAGVDRATTAVSVGTALQWLVALTKAATLHWSELSRARRDTTAALLLVGPLLTGIAALAQRAAQADARAAHDNMAENYRKMLDTENEAEEIDGSDKPAKLSVWQVIRTLKPYFWPRQRSGRVSVCLTWGFVAGSKVASVTAPLYIAQATNQLTRGDIEGCMQSSIIYGILLFVSKLLKEFQGLVYLGVSQAAFTDLSEDVFCHVHQLSLQW